MADKKPANVESVNLVEMLAEGEKLLKRLGILYNQYFAGSLKLPPQQLRLQVERMLRELTQETVRNSTLRHKMHSLSATYASMQALWGSKLRERETGRRAGRGSERVQKFSERRVKRFLHRETPKAAAGKAASSSPVEETNAPATAAEPMAAERAAVSDPTRSTPQEAAQRPVPGASAVEQLYDKIVAFQKSANQPPSFQSPEQLGKFLAVQKAKIEQQTGQKGIQIKVLVQDGKLKFKAQVPGAGPS